MRKGPSFEGVPSRKLRSGSTAASQFTPTPPLPPSEASEGTSPSGNLPCKLIVFSDAAPSVRLLRGLSPTPDTTVQRGKKKPCGGYEERERRGERLHTDYPPVLTAVSSVQERFVHLLGGASPLRHSCKLVHSLRADARLKIAFSTHTRPHDLSRLDAVYWQTS